jgi:hypothetical protein
MQTRILFLDDSGKPDAAHASKAVVIAGFALDSDAYPTFSRRVLGAKGRYFAGRGVPQAWELKSSNIIKPNPWKRAKNRNFCFEVVRILGSMGATVFSCSIDKTKMNHPMTLATTMPLQLQVLVEHFEAECAALGRTGLVVADWSSHQHDQHASQCVASFVASRKLRMHPCVYYAASHSNEGVQVADVISGTYRRVVEGDAGLNLLEQALTASRACQNVGKTTKGHLFANRKELI